MTEIIINWLPQLFSGFLVDVGVSMAAMAIGTVLGIFLGVGQLSHVAPYRVFSRYVTLFFRNSPWLVLLFFCIFLFPFYIDIGGYSFPFPAWLKGIIGLSLPVMGNVSEVIRGGVQSIPSAQWEAASALALNRRQTLRMVIFPQAVKRMLPPWMNTYAILMMATPLISIVGVEDSVTVARSMLAAEGDPALLMPVYGLVLLFFFVYCSPIAGFVRRLEKKYVTA